MSATGRKMMSTRQALVRALAVPHSTTAPGVSTYEIALLPPLDPEFIVRIVDDGREVILEAWGLTTKVDLVLVEQDRPHRRVARSEGLSPEDSAFRAEAVERRGWHEAVVCDAPSSERFREAMTDLDLDAMSVSSSPYGASPDGLGAVCNYRARGVLSPMISLCGWITFPRETETAFVAFCRAIYDCATSQFRSGRATEALESVYHRFYRHSLPLKDFCEGDIRVFRVFGWLNSEALRALSDHINANASTDAAILLDVSNLRGRARMGSEVLGRISRDRPGSVAWWAPNNAALRLEKAGVLPASIFTARTDAMVFLANHGRAHPR
jgi:hypothetical protein